MSTLLFATANKTESSPDPNLRRSSKHSLGFVWTVQDMYFGVLVLLKVCLIVFYFSFFVKYEWGWLHCCKNTLIIFIRMNKFQLASRFSSNQGFWVSSNSYIIIFVFSKRALIFLKIAIYNPRWTTFLVNPNAAKHDTSTLPLWKDKDKVKLFSLEPEHDS